ncbi:hypothetical protein ACFPM0_09955 [Pseudonocardia sulfidoxydans]|uniref:hypothetical protein n=1 Tax=Pseudonocardia sulfidoxydans TaxID=54011 RepID=UPI0036092B02
MTVRRGRMIGATDCVERRYDVDRDGPGLHASARRAATVADRATTGRAVLVVPPA